MKIINFILTDCPGKQKLDKDICQCKCKPGMPSVIPVDKTWNDNKCELECVDQNPQVAQGWRWDDQNCKAVCARKQSGKIQTEV